MVCRCGYSTIELRRDRGLTGHSTTSPGARGATERSITGVHHTCTHSRLTAAAMLPAEHSKAAAVPEDTCCTD